jgi:hypothetical protein
MSSITIIFCINYIKSHIFTIGDILSVYSSKTMVMEPFISREMESLSCILSSFSTNLFFNFSSTSQPNKYIFHYRSYFSKKTVSLLGSITWYILYNLVSMMMVSRISVLEDILGA